MNAVMRAWDRTGVTPYICEDKGSKDHQHVQHTKKLYYYSHGITLDVREFKLSESQLKAKLNEKGVVRKVSRRFRGISFMYVLRRTGSRSS